MADVVDKATRSRMMAGIKGKNTKPEMLIRRGLHQAGFRYRLHSTRLPGKPDLVFPKFLSVIFVHGCFWHGHCCKFFKWPKSNSIFWKNKIESNIVRDKMIVRLIRNRKWSVLVIWECQLRGRVAVDKSLQRASKFLNQKVPKE